jgi:hypothetical protein
MHLMYFRVRYIFGQGIEFLQPIDPFLGLYVWIVHSGECVMGNTYTYAQLFLHASLVVLEWTHIPHVPGAFISTFLFHVSNCNIPPPYNNSTAFLPPSTLRHHLLASTKDLHSMCLQHKMVLCKPMEHPKFGDLKFDDFQHRTCAYHVHSSCIHRLHIPLPSWSPTTFSPPLGQWTGRTNQPIREITNHSREIYGIYPKLIMENRKIATWTKFDLETQGFWLIMPKNFHGHCSRMRHYPLLCFRNVHFRMHFHVSWVHCT